MKLDVYVNYKGNCEEAFRFYEQHLGATLLSKMTHGEHKSPNIPPDFQSKILHAQLNLGGTILMGADIPGAEPMRSAYLSLELESDAEADRVYALLTEGGEVFMKMQETFFASRFAMLRDRFGTSWMLLHSRARTSS
jgi:PhnB protein